MHACALFNIARTPAYAYNNHRACEQRILSTAATVPASLLHQCLLSLLVHMTVYHIRTLHLPAPLDVPHASQPGSYISMELL